MCETRSSRYDTWGCLSKKETRKGKNCKSSYLSSMINLQEANILMNHCRHWWQCLSHAGRQALCECLDDVNYLGYVSSFKPWYIYQNIFQIWRLQYTIIWEVELVDLIWDSYSSPCFSLRKAANKTWCFGKGMEWKNTLHVWTKVLSNSSLYSNISKCFAKMDHLMSWLKQYTNRKKCNNFEIRRNVLAFSMIPRHVSFACQ